MHTHEITAAFRDILAEIGEGRFSLTFDLAEDGTTEAVKVIHWYRLGPHAFENVECIAVAPTAEAAIAEARRAAPLLRGKRIAADVARAAQLERQLAELRSRAA